MSKKIVLYFLLFLSSFNVYATFQTDWNVCNASAIHLSTYYHGYYVPTSVGVYPPTGQLAVYENSPYTLITYCVGNINSCPVGTTANLSNGNCDVVCTLPQVRNYNVSSGTYNTCLTPPNEYNCAAPSTWVLLTDDSWRCTIATSIPTVSGPNSLGVSGTAGAYAPESYLSELMCDTAMPYLCVPAPTDCSFWNIESLINLDCW